MDTLLNHTYWSSWQPRRGDKLVSKVHVARIEKYKTVYTRLPGAYPLHMTSGDFFIFASSFLFNTLLQ